MFAIQDHDRNQEASTQHVEMKIRTDERTNLSHARVTAFLK